MNTQQLISVIVPVYNVEKYLSKCVDSIRRQTYKNLEIILVDDGSPDQCPKICDEYAEKDDRIQVIHKKNGGPSDARNVALDIFHGQYLTFVDSDDYVTPDYVATLFHLLTKNDVDISCVQCIKAFDDKETVVKNYDYVEVLNTHDAIKKLLYFGGLGTAPYCKLYKAFLFQNIRFPFGKIFEDLGTIYKLFLKASKIANSPTQKYYYLQHQGSIETSPFSPQKMDILEMCKTLRKDVLPIYPDLASAWACRFVSANFHILLQIPKDQFPRETEILWKNIKQYRKTVFFDSKARKKARIASLITYLGQKTLKMIWNSSKTHI